jgi:hypothetical protein
MRLILGAGCRSAAVMGNRSRVRTSQQVSIMLGSLYHDSFPRFKKYASEISVVPFRKQMLTYVQPTE